MSCKKGACTTHHFTSLYIRPPVLSGIQWSVRTNRIVSISVFTHFVNLLLKFVPLGGSQYCNSHTHNQSTMASKVSSPSSSTSSNGHKMCATLLWSRHVVFLTVFLIMIVQSTISAPPPQQQAAEESSSSSSATENKIQKLPASETLFSNFSYIMVTPVDVHVSIGDTASFDIYLT